MRLLAFDEAPEHHQKQLSKFVEPCPCLRWAQLDAGDDVERLEVAVEGLKLDYASIKGPRSPTAKQWLAKLLDTGFSEAEAQRLAREATSSDERVKAGALAYLEGHARVLACKRTGWQETVEAAARGECITCGYAPCLCDQQ